VEDISGCYQDDQDPLGLDEFLDTIPTDSAQAFKALQQKV